MKNGAGTCWQSNTAPLATPIFNHSIETILASPSSSVTTQVITENVNSNTTNNILMVNGFKFELKGNIETKNPNGEILESPTNPSTPITSSAATSRASSPSTLPRRMSTRKKKEPTSWPSYSCIGIMF